MFNLEGTREFLKSNLPNWAINIFSKTRASLEAPFICMDTNYDLFKEFFDILDSNSVEGDVCEIGCFNGKGTRKLAEMTKGDKIFRQIFVIDLFENQNDENQDKNYKKQRGIWRQKMLFIFNTFFHKERINLIEKDSKKVQFPEEQKFAFSFIDGNHTYDYVLSDAGLIFLHTVKGGIIAFHDYHNLSDVKKAVDKFIEDHGNEVEIIKENQEYKTIFIKKLV